MLYENDAISELGKENSFSYEELINEFSTIFVGGTDTTSQLITMCLYNLISNPECFEKLKKELDEIVDIKNMSIKKFNCLKYLNAVIDETGRMYGPGTGIFFREALYDHRIQDITIKKGTLINIGVPFKNFNPLVYKDPELFKPERWLGESGEQLKKDPYNFLQFSAGKRNCIGQHLALMECASVLMILVREYKMELPKEYKLKMITRFLYEPFDPMIINIQKK